MRYVLIVSGVLLTALAGSVQPGEAAPFCLTSSLYQGMPDCTYRTWAQCRATLGGVGDYCYTNDRAGYVFDVSDPANPRVVTPQARRKARARH